MLRVRELREDRGLNLEELATLAGVTPATLSTLERGLRRPHPRTMKKVADALGVSIRDLREEPKEVQYVPVPEHLYAVLTARS